VDVHPEPDPILEPVHHLVDTVPPVRTADVVDEQPAVRDARPR
jgi:hypothetical protein